jgi:hypothetical protein
MGSRRCLFGQHGDPAGHVGIIGGVPAVSVSN